MVVGLYEEKVTASIPGIEIALCNVFKLAIHKTPFVSWLGSLICQNVDRSSPFDWMKIT